MLKEQKELLAKLRAAEQEARTLLDLGVKISGVFQKVRAAGDELETRVRFIEKQPAARRRNQFRRSGSTGEGSAAE